MGDIFLVFPKKLFTFHLLVKCVLLDLDLLPSLHHLTFTVLISTYSSLLHTQLSKLLAEPFVVVLLRNWQNQENQSIIF